MTAHADGFGTSAKIGVRGMADAMIAVTNDASRKRGRLKGLFVRTFFVHLGLESVTVRTYILNLVCSGRRESRPSDTPTCRAKSVSHDAASPMPIAYAVLGPQVRTPTGPSDILRLGNPISGIGSAR